MLPAISCLGKSRLAITVEAECLTKGSGIITISVNNAMDSSHIQEEYYEYYKKPKKNIMKRIYKGTFYSGLKSDYILIIRYYFDDL